MGGVGGGGVPVLAVEGGGSELWLLEVQEN